MIYKKYQHVEKYGSAETEGLLKGKVSLFHKIDGTNSCAFLDIDGNLKFGSRRREISLENDNQGFAAHFEEFKDEKQNLINLLNKLPKNSLVYGEWLIPVTLKCYKKEAWRNFYVFDIVTYDDDIDMETLFDDEKSRRCEHYMPYEDYLILCQECHLNYIPRIAVLENPTVEVIEGYLDHTNFLIDNGNIGEGIVIKNYDYRNPYGRTTWGKILTADFLNKKHKLRSENKKINDTNEYVYEAKMINKYATPEFLQKEIYKYKEANSECVDSLGKFQMKYFNNIMNSVFEEFIRDNLILFIGENKQAVINFSKLRKLLVQELKEQLL